MLYATYATGLVKLCVKKCRKAGFTKQLARVYFVGFCLIFSTAFSVSFVFPFLPFMVQFLLPSVEVTSLGRYTGLIASAVFLGRFFSNYIWGALADSKGHKPVALISAILTAIASLAFAFSTNFTLSVILRFIIGLLNATSVIGKAIISQWSTDNNHALGMSVATTSYGAGLVIGPALSGFLADPLNQYNITITNPAIESFFTMFPYSIPAIMSGLMFAFSAVIIVICLPKSIPNKPSTTTESAADDKSVENIVPVNVKYETDTDSVSVVIDVADDINLLDDKKPEKPGLLNRLKTKSRRLFKGIVTSSKDLKIFMCNRGSMLAITSYFTYSFAMIAFQEVYPLWCATPRHDGGLGFTLYQIGISLSVVGAIVLMFPLFLFPLLDHLIGVVKTFQLCAIINIVVILLLPNLHYLDNIPLLWILLILFLVLLRLAYDISFTSNYIFLNNSVTPDKLGSINGLAGSLSAFFRSVSPVFAGTVYSVSLTTGLGYPLNYHLMFIIIAGIILVVMLMVIGLPESIKRQKGLKETEKESNKTNSDNTEIQVQEKQNETKSNDVGTEDQEEQKIKNDVETAENDDRRIQPVHVHRAEI